MKKEIKKARVKTEIKNLGEKDTIEHYNAVLIENIKSEMKVVIEVVQESEIKSEKRDTELRKEMNQRFETVEAAIKHHTQEIKGLKTEMTGVQGEVKGLKTEMTNMEGRLTTKIDKIANRVDNHETRITNLEETAHTLP